MRSVKKFASLCSIVAVAAAFGFFAKMARAQTLDENSLKGLKWRQIGPFRGGRVLAVTGVAGDPETGMVGYKARRHTDVIDVDRTDFYDPRDFWEPVYSHRGEGIVLDPNDFYILASREAVSIPPDFAAEMMPFNPLVGEFRVHYAGFFDPGFGHETGMGRGSRAVLEVRSREVPFVLEHGQIIGRLVFERLTDTPPQVYGAALGSNYQRQGLKLSKHFQLP